jgi:flap endonuclease-1
MGIRHLNKFLKENCHESIRCIHMSDLSGKRIAVDVSIYLYKYEADDTLLESIYLMLAIFQNYNVIPIFIFDGKPPAEKKELLQKRKSDKLQAQEEYNRLKEKLSSNIDNDDAQDIINTMDQLKKQFIHISREKIEMVKSLIRAWGCTYYDAPCEADELCAMLVTKKKVWACMSEDMDMFVYGCNRVLRYFSLISHNVVLYYMKGILNEISMTHKEFKEICIISGTDYNINANGKNNEINLLQMIKLFKKYKHSASVNDYKEDFYNWLQANSHSHPDFELLNKINKMFDITENHFDLENFKKIKIVNGPSKEKQIEDIMKTDGFIFAH